MSVGEDSDFQINMLISPPAWRASLHHPIFSPAHPNLRRLPLLGLKEPSGALLQLKRSISLEKDNLT